MGSKETESDVGSGYREHSYQEWNDAIARHFFRAESNGKRVFLAVTNDTIDDIASAIQAQPSSFVSAVLAGPPGLTRSGLCQRALQTFEKWQAKRADFPPYVAFLALFVLAAAVDGDFPPHAYYPRLRQLAGLEENGRVPSFDRMFELWDDLEKWSQVDRHGELGIFRATIAGRQFHIGLPISQNILTNAERSALPQIFSEAALDPATPPSDAELASVLLLQGRTHLKARTLAKLRRDADQEQRDLLIDAVADELEDWDGEIHQAGGGDAGVNQKTGALRLAMHVDLIAQRALISLRCTAANALPAEDMVLSNPVDGAEFKCEDDGAVWSTALRSGETQFDASTIDWRNDLILIDKATNWRFPLKGSAVRIFVDGISYGLGGLIEVFRLPAGQACLIAFSRNFDSLFLPWLGKCVDVKDVTPRVGFPSGWRLFSVQRVVSDEHISERFPRLSTSRNFRIRFQGGVKGRGGSNYFPFAPPSILIEGASGSEKVSCNGIGAAQISIPGAYRVPDLLVGEPFVTVVASDGTRESRKSFTQLAGVRVGSSAPLEFFDRWHTRLTQGANKTWQIAGALMNGAEKSIPFSLFAPSALGPNPAKYRRITFLGSTPGEVYDWNPKDALEIPFKPTWFVGSGAGRDAFYCEDYFGNDRISNQPSRKAIRRWKEIVWYGRKSIKPPNDVILSRKWREFVESAYGV